MRYIVVVIFMCFIVSIASVVYAEEQIDHYCKNECLGKGNTFGNCNSICAMTDSSGNPLKEKMECVSACLKEKGWLRYYCYSECK